MITDDEKAAIKDSWRLVVPIAETAADLFYKRLFELHPEYRRLFTDDMRAQKRKLVAMLAFIVKSLDWPESSWRETVPEEDDLCLSSPRSREAPSGISIRSPTPSMKVAGEALPWTLRLRPRQEVRRSATRAAWTRVYQLLALTPMKMGRLSVPRSRPQGGQRLEPPRRPTLQRQRGPTREMETRRR